MKLPICSLADPRVLPKLPPQVSKAAQQRIELEEPRMMRLSRSKTPQKTRSAISELPALRAPRAPLMDAQEKVERPVLKQNMVEFTLTLD